MSRTPQDENKAYNRLNYDRNYDDIFMRCVALGVTDELNGRINWLNKFSDETKEVSCRFLHSLTGDELFNLDAFYDDVPSEMRVNGNIDPTPRAVVYPASWSIASSEFTNPDIRVVGIEDNDGVISKYTGKLKSIPINAEFNVKVKLDSIGDAMKYSERFAQEMWPFRFFTFKYQQFRVEGVMNIPDNKSITIPREISQTSENRPSIEHSISIKTYQPVVTERSPVNKGRIGQWTMRIWDAKLGNRPDNGEGWPNMLNNKPDNYAKQIRELEERAKRNKPNC